MTVIDREDLIRNCVLGLQKLDGHKLHAANACIDALLAIGPNATAVMVGIAKRLTAGTEYGDFEVNKRWVAETSEELLDAVVYLTVKTMGLTR
jgi:hypothetical protein